MTKLNPYLTLPGTAAEAIEHYRRVFRAEPVSVTRYREMAAAGMPSPSAEGGERIIHAMFQIGNDQLMLSDAPEGQDDTIVFGTSTQVSVHPESRAEADRIFAALTDGGEAVMPMMDAPWGDYFGMVEDRFGIRWMVNHHEETR